MRIGGFDFDGRDAGGAGGGCNGIFKCLGITPGRTRYDGILPRVIDIIPIFYIIFCAAQWRMGDQSLVQEQLPPETNLKGEKLSLNVRCASYRKFYSCLAPELFHIQYQDTEPQIS